MTIKNLSEYQILFDKIPKIKQKIKKELSLEQLKSLDVIYKFYTSQNKNNTKNLLREKYKKILKEKISINLLKKKSLILNKKIIDTNEYEKASVIFCFISFNKEIDTNFLITNILNSGKTLCVPWIKNKTMCAIKIKDMKNLSKNKYGILEPTTGEEISKNLIDLTIVPGLVFNPLGYRIGYGGGYYDKFLSGYKNISFSMVLREFVSMDFIPERYDQPVDRLFIV